MKNRDKILITLIVLSGVFTYKLLFFKNLGIQMLGNTVTDRFEGAQHSFFIFSALLIGSYLVYTKNKWLGYLAALCSIGFLKTFLCQHAPMLDLLNGALVGGCIFALYYMFRTFRTNETMLKFFLIPAGLNIILVIVQAFDNNFLSFMPVEGITGFLGNASVTACFLALTTPIFIKHYKKGLPFLILAVLLCKSAVAILIMLSSGLVYLAFTNKRAFKIALVVSLIVLAIGGIYKRDRIKVEFGHRRAMYLGTIDGCLRNPVLGWGLGSFKKVMRQIPRSETVYFGYSFNYDTTAQGKEAYMDNPHNEMLLGWWNFGILFPIVFIGYWVNTIRQFTKEKLLSFSILVGVFICMMGYFLSYPAWFLAVFAMALYDNREVTQWHQRKLKVLKKL